jgi:hypothetical protein
MVEHEEAITKREKKRCQENEATCASLFNLTKRATKVEESLAKAKAMEAEAKLLAEERETVFIDMTKVPNWTKLLGGEGSCHHPRTRGVIAYELVQR